MDADNSTRINLQNPTVLAELLRCTPWSREALAAGAIPTLDETTALERAKILSEDSAALGLEWPIRVTGGEEMVLPYYDIPGTDFGETDNEDAEEVQKAHGFGLNWGSLVKFSKACAIGRAKFGSDWPKKFRPHLTNAKDHLPTIEELLWVSLWLQTNNLEREARPFLHAGFKKRVDWRFDCCGQIINLEVKYRPKDWIRRVDGAEFTRVFDSYYHDVPQKFPLRNEGELNVVGISSLAPEDRQWSLVTEKLLNENPTIDGVILWSQHSDGEKTFNIHSKRKALIELFFNGGSFEDKAHFGLIRHLWRNRDERRAMNVGESIVALQRELGGRSNEVYRVEPPF